MSIGINFAASSSLWSQPRPKCDDNVEEEPLPRKFIMSSPSLSSIAIFYRRSQSHKTCVCEGNVNQLLEEFESFVCSCDKLKRMCHNFFERTK